MRFKEKIYLSLTALATLIIIGLLSYIIFDILKNGIGVITWEFLSQPPREGMTKGGIFPAIYGTLVRTLLMLVFVVPIGVFTAIYLNEYGRGSNFSKWIRLAINNLASVPSIVFGLFGMGFFVLFLRLGAGLLSAALTIGILTLPIVVVSTEEALRAVPNSYREAGFALGATKWQVIRSIVLPQALPGILTGAILSVGRGMGEVAPLLFTGVAYYLPYLPSSIFDQFMDLGYHIYIMTTQSFNIELTRPIQYGTALVLLMLTLSFNIIAIFIRYRMRRKRS
ncbi:MAG TPA: phosphate ABC transporter permease PstA [bacterium]|jgi:phosphate transport system permease protein|nr:phosphate ABC transporter permease PstA [bacterium]HOK29185.1 phosphate ABC transporter permease PstA [bacterium]HOL54541.1 phosphate ABC transporter permease PstA [bacterium]HOP55999.1 phosphate ABC transporter permease PstA [bacterium]HPO81574.1 phosphate ABC transporter permease PstA [bacterium]